MTNDIGHSVLVIGADGFIGQHIVRRLSQKDYFVYATHFPTNTPPSIDRVNWISCDLSEFSAERTWPSHCDSVIYLAQSQHWRDFPDGAADMVSINTVGAIRAAEYARITGASRMIFMSSGSVYSQSERPAQETELLDFNQIDSFYNASKIAAEVLLKPYGNLFALVILRLFMPYGSGQNSTMLLPVLVRRVQEGKVINLYGNDGLIANPIAVADVAETLERCLKLKQSTTLNVAGPEALTLREIGTQIGQVIGKEPVFKAHKEAPIKFIVGDITALRTALDWAPKIKLKQGLRTFLTKDKSMF